MRLARLVLLLFAVAAIVVGPAAPAGHAVTPVPGSLTRYTISGVYAAGVSSGGYMATQLHVAYSGTFRGAAVFAAGPYYCAQGSLNQATLACMNDLADDQLPTLEQITRDWSAQGRIDPVANLAGDPVYVFHGTNDSTVKASVTDDLVTFYRDFGASVTYVNSVGAGHAWISPRGPNPCATSYTPYINNCGIDPEGAFLRQLLGSVNPPNTGSLTGTLIQFSQHQYAPYGNAASVSMGASGFAYVPSACASGATCRLLVALHGCQQGYGTIGTQFVDTAYLNEYADTNQLIVLYPQAAVTWGSNPQGCWDWWGYLDSDYATRTGAQVETIMRMVRALGG